MRTKSKELRQAIELAKVLDPNNVEQLDDMIYLLMVHVKNNGSQSSFAFVHSFLRHPKLRLKFLSEEAHIALRNRVEDTAMHYMQWMSGVKSAKTKAELKRRGFIGGGRHVA